MQSMFQRIYRLKKIMKVDYLTGKKSIKGLRNDLKMEKDL